jgi:hypothetical protein
MTKLKDVTNFIVGYTYPGEVAYDSTNSKANEERPPKYNLFPFFSVICVSATEFYINYMLILRVYDLRPRLFITVLRMSLVRVL